MTVNEEEHVSRSRYSRECKARAKAESLLEERSRELFEANQTLSESSVRLEAAVRERTAELESAVLRAESAFAARSRFVATMSHEIRTPLGGLLGMIDLLSMDETNPNKLELLDYAKSAGNGLRRIVNDVLDFSKMEAGVFVFENERVDIRALVESVRSLYSSQGKGASRTITCMIDESVPNQFLSDGTRIRQIISNLVSNAIRYSKDGPIIVRARADPHKEGVTLRVEVEDFGVGIPSEKFSDLFKDFSQVANPLTAAAEGTGLGLAICKRIVNGLAGNIGADSRWGAGSTFWFEIPVEVVSSRLPSISSGKSPVNATHLNCIEGKRVLIAEDNPINQKMLLIFTARMRLQADLAENGRIAFEKFTPGKYDLILMDIAMPEMDGIEATRRICGKWPKESLPPIIALTAHFADSIEDEAKLVGFTRMLSKPIPFEELKSAIVADLSFHDKNLIGERSLEPLEEEVGSCTALTKIFSADVVKTHLQSMTENELIELTSNFIVDSSSRIERIMEAILGGDRMAVNQQAHSLKGACLTLGLERLANWAQCMEQHQFHLELEAVSPTASKFVSELNRFNTLLQRVTVQ